MPLLLGAWRAYVVNNKLEDDRSITWETQSNSNINIFHDHGYILIYYTGYILAIVYIDQCTNHIILNMDIFTEASGKYRRVEECQKWKVFSQKTSKTLAVYESEHFGWDKVINLILKLAVHTGHFREATTVTV